MLFFIIPFIVILILNITYALSGGDDYLYYFEYCERLEVNISGDLQIDDGEYIINSACDKNGTDYWICNCSNDWYFNLTPSLNTINNYSISFIYDYEVEKKSGSGGSSRRRDTDTYPEVENATNESRNDTISEPSVEDKPLVDESGKDKVVAPPSSNTEEQKETTSTGKSQLDVDRDNTETDGNGEEQKEKTKGIIKWWMVPLFILIILIISVSLFMFFLFKEEQAEGVGRTETQIKREIKEVEDNINRR